MLTSALGRAYLAFCPKREAEHILAHLGRFGDPIDPEADVGPRTQAALQLVREQGYALEQRIAYPTLRA